MWRETPHPLIQRRATDADGNEKDSFRSPAKGALLAVVADHIVQGRVLFPGGEPAALDGAGRERGGDHDGPGHAGAVRAGHGSQAGGRRPPRHRQR